MATEDDKIETSIPESPGAKVRYQGLYLGMTLGGRYIVEKEIARGGIGIVYLARDKPLHFRPVVIKVLFEDSDHDIWFAKKFHQEIEALARLDHPGVVGILDAGETPNNRPFLVMQYVNGRTLRQEINDREVSLEFVAEVIRQASLALSAAHDQEITHCDLKPENIMLQDLGEGEIQVKIVDFGIAKIKGSQIASGNDTTKVAGTIPYMSPDQIMGNPSTSSDVFALGVIAYEMLTGRLPYTPKTPYQLLDMHRAGPKKKPRDLRPELPEAAEEVILKALSFDPKDRYSRARDFGYELMQALTDKDETNPALKLTRVVILCKRDAQPDKQVMELLENHLQANKCKVFSDQYSMTGVNWAVDTERQLRTADAVVVLLSATSVESEALAFEVEIAYEAAQKRRGRPRLIAVQVAYAGAVPSPLADFLDATCYLSWKDSQDDERLATELLELIHSPTKPLSLTWGLKPVNLSDLSESVYGAMSLDSPFYIKRPTDDKFHAALARRDSIVLVKGARQMGKTSLLARGLQQARESNSKIVLTDLQKFNSSHLESVETLFLAFAEMIADQLDIDSLPEEGWSPRRGPSANFERYLRREIIGKITQPLVWGLDEIDRIITYDYVSEIFGLFRSWHNQRALDPLGPWQRLTIVLVYATESHLFITDPNQSPFNVGTKLELEDFNLDQIKDLNARYDSPLKDEQGIQYFFSLLGGHPYLVHNSLREMATQAIGITAFEEQACRDEGPFGDHLRRILFLLAKDPDLRNAVKSMLLGDSLPSDRSFYRLRSAGVISGDSAIDAKLRCKLYENYLRRHLT